MTDAEACARDREVARLELALLGKWLRDNLITPGEAAEKFSKVMGSVPDGVFASIGIPRDLLDPGLPGRATPRQDGATDDERRGRFIEWLGLVEGLLK